MTTDKLIKSSKQVVFISLIIGTMIFSMFLVSSGVGIGLFGLLFIAIAGFVNLIYLTMLIIRIFKESEPRGIIFKSIGFILLNIPFLIAYSWIALIWIDTLRITFINDTSACLTNIKVIGCDDRTIERIEKGQSKTVWLKITGDCGTSINYKLNGVEKSEEVTGYVTNGNGYSMTFKIGTNQKPYDHDL